jgi:hypothetical protein
VVSPYARGTVAQGPAKCMDGILPVTAGCIKWVVGCPGALTAVMSGNSGVCRWCGAMLFSGEAITHP